jgi:RNA polymerase sigma-70 factor (ECF subfamily)
VRRYQRPVINLIYRITGDPALSEDLAQETFVKAFRNLAAFDTTRRFSSWIFRIAHHTAIDALRRVRATHVPLEAARPQELARPADSDPVERESLARALDAALRELRPEYRAAVALRYDEGLSFEEIGQVMGIPEATARTYVHRARKDLGKRLAAAGWGGDTGR